MITEIHIQLTKYLIKEYLKKSVLTYYANMDNTVFNIYLL